MTALFGFLLFWLGAAILYIGPFVVAVRTRTMLAGCGFNIVFFFGGGAVFMGLATVNLSYSSTLIPSRASAALAWCVILFAVSSTLRKPLPVQDPQELVGHRE